MSLFHYPKRQQARALKPPQYKNYGTYKRWLQAEFRRVCVYCRQPDSGEFGLFFTVDHYRPKGLPKFAPLAASYANLFYCCPPCNSRKNNYWPKDEAKGPLIPNPCDHNMAKHLRHADGVVISETPEGAFTVKLLQLNDPERVAYRRMTVHLVELLETQLRDAQKTLAEAKKSLARRPPPTQAEVVEIDADCDALHAVIRAHSDAHRRLAGLDPTPLMIAHGLTFG